MGALQLCTSCSLLFSPSDAPGQAGDAGIDAASASDGAIADWQFNVVEHDTGLGAFQLAVSNNQVAIASALGTDTYLVLLTPSGDMQMATVPGLGAIGFVGDDLVVGQLSEDGAASKVVISRLLDLESGLVDSFSIAAEQPPLAISSMGDDPAILIRNAVDELYWHKGGTLQQRNIGTSDIRAIAGTGNEVFCAAGDGILAVDPLGTLSDIVIGTGQVSSLDVGAAAFFWSTDDGVFTEPLAPPRTTTVLVDTNDGRPDKISHIAAFGDFVVYVEGMHLCRVRNDAPGSEECLEEEFASWAQGDLAIAANEQAVYVLSIPSGELLEFVFDGVAP